MSKIEVNQISSQCGSTLTIGQSGDTVTLAAGATQTGFGRTGTVDWDTTAKTASFTAVSGNGYFVNTTSGAITVTLPASPSAGDIVALQDYSGTWGTNNVTIGRNGSNIGGASSDPVLSTSNQSITLVYVDATRGWQTVNDSTQSVAGALYVTATGGTVTCCGDYKIHTFTGPGTFCVSCAGNAQGSSSVDYLVVAGGGGAGENRGGGGGGGGYRESSGATSGCYSRSPLGACVSALPVSASPYPITVGGGGAGANGTVAVNGSNSIFSTITSAGGGHGGAPPSNNGTPGGSGAGARASDGTSGSGGTGNQPPVSPPQGNPGGSGSTTANGAGGGGGGATGSGTPAPPSGPGLIAGNGGAGATSSINGTPTGRSGGGGGSPWNVCTGGTATDGGGAGVRTTPASGGSNPGTVNTGGGGGSGLDGGGGSGGSGIVIIRYKFQ
jgi:hypothetical protein